MIKEIMLASALSFTTMNFDNTDHYLNLEGNKYNIGSVDVYDFFPPSQYEAKNLNCFLIRPFDNFAVGMAQFIPGRSVIDSYENYVVQYGDNFSFSNYIETNYNEHFSNYRLHFVIDSNAFVFDNSHYDEIYITLLSFDEADNLISIESESYMLSIVDNGQTIMYPSFDLSFDYDITNDNHITGTYSMAFMFSSDPLYEEDGEQWLDYSWNGSYLENLDIWSYTDIMYTATKTVNGESERINLMDGLIFTNNDLNDLYNEFNNKINTLNNQYQDNINNLASQYQTQVDALTRDLTDLMSDYHKLELDFERVSLENEQLNSKFVFNNTFDLLSKAVESVSNFLNIEIAPNITIGMVVTIPIIVAVVLFVLKGLIQ